MKSPENMGLPSKEERLEQSLSKLDEKTQAILRSHLKNGTQKNAENNEQFVITPQMRADAVKHATFHRGRQQP